MKKMCLALFLGLLFAVPSLASTEIEVEGGTIIVDSLGVAGDVVTISVEPDSGYALYSITVKDTSGSEIGVVANSDGTYYFIMPAKPITIYAVFALATSPIVKSSIAVGSSLIRSSGSQLRISTNKAQQARIYGVNGKLVKSQNLPAGETLVNGLNSGFYMVKLSDGTKASVSIR